MSKRKSNAVTAVTAERPDDAAPGVQVGGIAYAPDAAPLPGYESVRLLRDHTHAGRDHLAGETITVSAADSRWLIDHDIGTTEESK